MCVLLYYKQINGDGDGEMGALKSREWTSRHQVARVDIAGVDIAEVIGSRKLSCSL